MTGSKDQPVISGVIRSTIAPTASFGVLRPSTASCISSRNIACARAALGNAGSGTRAFESAFASTAAIGWAATFLGRMQSRHAHQAVLYQNKLVAVDTADYIIRVASGPTREKLLADMVTALLSNERSAFVSDPTPRSKVPFDEIRKTVDTFAAAAKPPAVSVRADSN